MTSFMRNYLDKIVKTVENSDSYLDAIEELEEIITEMPIQIKKGIKNTKVTVTSNGVVVEPNEDRIRR
jgi:hypothetical protein